LDGAVTLIDRQVLAEIGGLDERFFLYAEDVDLGLRLNRYGRRVVMAPSARAAQAPSGSIDPYLWTRNTFLLFHRRGFRIAWCLWLASVLTGLVRDTLCLRARSAEVPRRMRALRDGMANRWGAPPVRE
jgi:GT2 family glycosyltransferase